MISLTSVANFVLYIIVAGLVFWLLDWLLGYCGVPEPFAKVGRVILAVAAVFVLIYALISLVGGGPMLFRP